MKYEKLNRERKGFLVEKAKYIEVPEVKSANSGRKKLEIVGILDEEDQLNLLATLVEQIGEKIGLDTVEFVYAKQEFLKIKNILSGT